MYVLMLHLEFITLYVYKSVLNDCVSVAALQIGSSAIFLLWQNSHTVHHFNYFKMYISVAFSTFTELCNHPHCQVPEHFYHPQSKLSAHWALTPISPQPQTSTNLVSVSVDFPTVGVSYKGIHIICGLLCLAPFTRHNEFRFIYVAARISSSFLWINNIPSYTYTNISLSVHPLMDIIVVSAFWPLWIQFTL